ncbi:MAG: VWD domain-containing protein [Flavobacteriia bacterium]|jgi:hypothetical protein
MKKIFTLSILNVFTVLAAFSQTQFQKDYEAVRTELVTWDAVRGEWLANSFEAMANKQSIPDRTFPEDLTPNELYRLVPKETKQNVQAIVIDNSRRATETSQKDAWKKVAVMTESGLCKPVSARSYGDPHLSSFDGASFSFQTVGEFIMTKSQAGHMEVQARQKASGDNVSLNSALAMNVAGDRFCVYPNEKPDNERSTPFRLNGNAITLSDKTYNLPHGGTIVKTGRNDYIVNWPTGERVIFDIRNSAAFDFINLQIEILPCLEEQFNGVLGNANGILSDDFKTSSGRNPQGNFVSYVSFGNDEANRIAKDIEKQHLAYLAQDFADEWRVNNENTLFDYGFGQNTLSFTDRSFPRVHQTIDDLNDDQRATARRSCEEAGIRGADLNGCIYDRGFLNIPANPRPVVVDRSEGVVLTKIDKPVKVVSDPFTKPEKTKPTEIDDSSTSPVEKTRTDHAKPVKTHDESEDTKPVEKKSKWYEKTTPSTEKSEPEKNTSTPIFKEKKTESTPVYTPKSTPVSTPKSTPTSSPVSTPKSTPVSTPKTTPVSKPTTPSTPVSVPVKKGKG